MNTFFDFIFQNFNYIILGLIFLILIWLILVQVQIFKVSKRLKRVFRGSKAKDLEEILLREIRDLERAQDKIKELQKISRHLDKMASASIQRIGIIRFNPFKDIGGDQSFSIALLDSKNNGLVISSLFSKEGARLYTKPIEAEKSLYNLSTEEKEAIKKATSE